MTGSLDGPFDGPVERDALLERIRRHPIDGDAEARRRTFADLMLGADAERTAESVRIPGEGGTIVYLHGGGYAFGSPGTHARVGHALAAATGLSVVLPSYPLAPEHVWPSQLDAAMAACEEATGPVVLAGDSAGGHLALVTALALARRGAELAGLMLFSPNTDRTGRSTTRTAHETTDPMVDDEGDTELARQCFGDRAADDPEVSPLLADLALLPPLLLEVGGGEVLLDDTLLLAEAARAAGVRVHLHIEPEGLHMMQLWAPWWPPAVASLQRAASFASAVTGSQPPDIRSRRNGSGT